LNSCPLLTIAIPTYNRVDKLKRLINNILNQSFSFSEEIELMISNNSSTDETSQFLETLIINHRNLKVKTYNQETNLGFDGNISFLYHNSNSKYIWFFADDDLLLPDTINTIVDTLKREEPSALLFSFGQPPGSTRGSFTFKDIVSSFYDKKYLVELSVKWPKISTYLLLNTKFTEEDSAFVETQFGFGWMHLCLIFSVLNYYEKPKLTIISKVLAECDEEFDMLSWSPSYISDSYHVFNHPFVIKNCPNILESKIHSSYIDTIQFCFAAKVGALKVLNIYEYDDLILKLKFNRFLFYYPKSFLQLLILKLKLINLYLLLKKIVS
jgi:glycosyltransferase involved in cell wall biosynthesis